MYKPSSHYNLVVFTVACNISNADGAETVMLSLSPILSVLPDVAVAEFKELVTVSDAPVIGVPFISRETVALPASHIALISSIVQG